MAKTIVLTEEEKKRFLSMFKPSVNPGYCAHCNVWSDLEQYGRQKLCRPCINWLHARREEQA